MDSINFSSLVSQIQYTHDTLQENAHLVINRHVTAKAWLTGYYIVEFEQKGEDRAKYGEKLLQNLADRLQDKKAFSYRSLRLYRQFYLTYPMINTQISNFVMSLPEIWQSPSAKLQLADNNEDIKWQTPSAQLPVVQNTESPVQTKPSTSTKICSSRNMNLAFLRRNA